MDGGFGRKIKATDGTRHLQEGFHIAGWQLVFWSFEWTCQLLSELHVTMIF